MKNEKKIKWALIVLVVMNIVLVGVIAATIFGVRLPGMPMGGGMEFALNARSKDFVFRELNLDQAQKKKFKQSLDTLFWETHNIKERRRKLLQSAFLGIFEPEAGGASVSAVLESIGNCEEALIKLQLEHLLEIKNMSSPNQVQKLKEVFMRVVNRPPPPMVRPPEKPAR